MFGFEGCWTNQIGRLEGYALQNFLCPAAFRLVVYDNFTVIDKCGRRKREVSDLDPLFKGFPYFSVLVFATEIQRYNSDNDEFILPRKG